MDIPISSGSEVAFFVRNDHYDSGIKKHDMVVGKALKVERLGIKNSIFVSGTTTGTTKHFMFDRIYKEGTIPEVYSNNEDCNKCCWLYNPYTVELL